MRKKEEETKYYSVDIGAYTSDSYTSTLGYYRCYDMSGVNFLYLEQTKKADSKVTIIVDVNGRDIITGEQYHEYFGHSYQDKFLFTKETKVIYPYVFYVTKIKNIELINCHECFTNKYYLKEDYNMLFYKNKNAVYIDEVLRSLKVVQKYGKDAYINAINKKREYVMNNVYDNYRAVRDAKKVEDELQRKNDEVKQLVKKIK